MSVDMEQCIHRHRLALKRKCSWTPWNASHFLETWLEMRGRRSRRTVSYEWRPPQRILYYRVLGRENSQHMNMRVCFSAILVQLLRLELWLGGMCDSICTNRSLTLRPWSTDWTEGRIKTPVEGPIKLASRVTETARRTKRQSLITSRWGSCKRQAFWIGDFHFETLRRFNMSESSRYVSA